MIAYSVNNLAQQFSASLLETVGPQWKSRRYVLAVSGGADSMALLQCAHRAIAAEQLLVAHFNHATRAEQSDEDAQFVKAQAQVLQIAFVSERFTGDARDEATLRRARLDFLESVRERHGMDFILTGHHANDQLETVLFRLVRGSGMDGLSGIAPRRGVWIRPLIKLSAATIRSAMAEQGVAFRQDASNESWAYARNRVRHRVVPALVEEAQSFGGAENFLSRFNALTDELRDVSAFMDDAAERWVSQHGANLPLGLRLAIEPFRQLSPLLQNRILRRSFATVPTRDELELIRLALLRESNHSGALRMELRCSMGYAYLQGGVVTPQLKPICVAENCIIDERLGLEITTREPAAPWIERLRLVRDGDRFANKTVRRLLMARRVPWPERAWLPVLGTEGSDVEWVYGSPHPLIIRQTLRHSFLFA